MISYDDILMFAKVVALGGFSNTARALHLSHTTVARRIKHLEDSLGGSLFSRTVHNFKLTEFGSFLYAKISSHIEHQEQLLLEIDKMRDWKDTPPSGNLNIILNPVLSDYIIAQHIPKFIRKYPGINLNIIYTTEQIDLIKESADIAIIYEVPQQMDQKIIKIYTDEVVLYCSKRYVEKYGLPDSPTDLLNHLSVSFVYQGFVKLDKFNFTHKVTGDITPLKRIANLNSSSMAQSIHFLQTDEVIVPITNLLWSTLVNKEDFVHVLPDYNIFTINYYLLKNKYSNAKNVKLFADFLVDIFKNLPANRMYL